MSGQIGKFFWLRDIFERFVFTVIKCVSPSLADYALQVYPTASRPDVRMHLAIKCSEISNKKDPTREAYVKSYNLYAPSYQMMSNKRDPII